MKILIIMPWIKQGGAELIAVQTAYQLQKLGNQIKLAAAWVDFSKMGKFKKIARQINYLTAGKIGHFLSNSKWLTYFVSPFFLLYLILKNVAWADLLFPQSLPSYWLAVIIGKIFNKKIIWLCNEPPKKKKLGQVPFSDWLLWQLADSWLDKLLVKGIDKIIVYSNLIKKEVKHRYQKPATVIRLGINYSFFSAKDQVLVNKLKKRYSLKNKFILLSVGKLDKQKNPHLSIKVLAQILPQVPQAVLVLVGSGPEEKVLRDSSKKTKVNDQVIFAGFCQPEEVRAWYSLVDLVLSPHLEQTEMVDSSWGFTPFEALCQQKLSVVSTNSGAAEVIKPNKIGFTCPVKLKPFSQIALEYYKNQKKYQQWAERGEQWVKENLSWEKFAKEVNNHLKVLS
jgi:glycosyltransferase involved in cell wall biosynthesis